MIADFLRRPATAAEWTADIVRGIGVASVIAAALWWSLTDAGILAFALPALLLPRFVGVRAWVDILYGCIILIAAWSNVLGLYETVPWWDLLVHFACTGVLAAMLYLVLARCSVVPLPPPARGTARTPIVIVTALGLALSSVWEMVEWFGWRYISDEIYVSYQDTIGDMALGALGGLVASLVVAYAPLLRDAGDGLDGW